MSLRYFQYDRLPLAETVEIGCKKLALNTLPKGLHILEDAGLAGVDGLDGAVLYRAVNEMFEVRAAITPGGDYLVMFPAGGHYGGSDYKKVNTMMALRSSDKGKTWSDPYVAFKNIDFNQHGFIPLIPKGSKRIYSFGTQPVWGLYTREHGLNENAPVGYFYSDDDGYTWTGPTIINPVNDPGFTGMSVMRMCETNRGTWLLGAHECLFDPRPMTSNQYILRSEDQGKTWEVLPSKRKNGWHSMPIHRMDEGRPIPVGDDILLLARTPEGHLWALWSKDDGKTWTNPQPTPLIHPDAPPMITHLSDGKTLVCLHHNRFHDTNYTDFDTNKEELMGDRSEIWAALSKDCGRTWSEPGFLYCNALKPNKRGPFFNNQCSYNDLFVDGDVLNIFLPHRWEEALHLQIKEADLFNLPKKADLV
jgi:Neuraminidase (sialidase)